MGEVWAWLTVAIDAVFDAHAHHRIRCKTVARRLSWRLRAVQPALANGWLAAQPGCLLARMSGSGATCFGLFADAAPAETAARVLAADNANWWVAATSLITN